MPQATIVRQRLIYSFPSLLKYTLFICISTLLITQSLLADIYHVNNQTGSDKNNARTPEMAVATIAHVVSLCKAGDTISLKETGVAYRESFILRKLGGTAAKPLIVEGNGAVLSGLTALQSESWKQIAGDVYFYSYEKAPYGNPFVVQKNERLKQAASVDQLQAEEYFWDRKSGISFRCAAGKTLADYQLEATGRTSGLTLQSASYVVCRNLICEYFSNDGFNIHGDCRGIRLENVVARHNGDDGISIHETGGLVVQNAHVHHNFYGLQDVNASRSVYNGMLVEDNQVGVSMAGGYHSLVDSIVRRNVRSQVDIVGNAPKHLIGSEFNPLCRTIFFARNVVMQGGGSPVGVMVRDKSQVILENCIISNSKVGLSIAKEGVCHLTTSVVEKCEIDLASQTEKVFSDYNIFSGGRMQWLGEDFQPAQWKAFCEQAKHNSHSRIGAVTVSPAGQVTIPKNSTAKPIEKTVGPSQPLAISFLKE